MPGTAWAQDEHHYGDRYTTTMAVEVNTSISSAGLVVTPTFSAFRHHHKVSAGIMAPVYDVWGHGQGYGGLQLGYQVFPDRRRKYTNLYFSYNMALFIRDRSSVAPEIPRETGQPLLTDLNYRYEHLLGMGVETHLGKRAYLFLDWNVGVSLNWLTLKNFPAIFEWHSSGMGRIGMGFNIGKRRAK